MNLYNIIVRTELLVVHDIIRQCDVTGVDTLSAAKFATKAAHDAFVADGWEITSSTPMGTGFSYFVAERDNEKTEIQLTKAIV